MTGKDYLNWLNESEKSKWIENYDSLNKLDAPIEDFLEEEHPSWTVFLGTSFEFTKTSEGNDYWGEVYHKYKKYDNINVKPGFSNFGTLSEPKIL
jgi:hypothetical protein